ncbi:MAG: GNAT family N-acetyltransferase [Syntrophales bacterium]|nr:GNAT family N-acetyltransferase [Syntrophales bacterium]
METRELQASELDDLLVLYAQLHDADVSLPDRSRVTATWREIQENSRLKYFGVYTDGRLVSSCTLSIIPNLTRGCRPYGLVENVVTHKDFRRKGCGKAVLQHALQYAWRRGCYKVMLMTGRRDEGTYQFYESAGFDRHAKQAFLAKPQGKDR